MLTLGKHYPRWKLDPQVRMFLSLQYPNQLDWDQIERHQQFWPDKSSVGHSGSRIKRLYISSDCQRHPTEFILSIPTKNWQLQSIASTCRPSHVILERCFRTFPYQHSLVRYCIIFKLEFSPKYLGSSFSRTIRRISVTYGADRFWSFNQAWHASLGETYTGWLGLTKRCMASSKLCRIVKQLSIECVTLAAMDHVGSNWSCWRRWIRLVQSYG